MRYRAYALILALVFSFLCSCNGLKFITDPEAHKQTQKQGIIQPAQNPGPSHRTDKDIRFHQFAVLLCLLVLWGLYRAYKRKPEQTVRLSREDIGVMHIAFSSMETLWQRFNPRSNVVRGYFEKKGD